MFTQDQFDLVASMFVSVHAEILEHAANQADYEGVVAALVREWLHANRSVLVQFPVDEIVATVQYNVC